MTNPETPSHTQYFNIERVHSLVNPDDQTWPFGRGDALSDYLYRPTLKASTAEPLKVFIDTVKPMIDEMYIGDEYNELIIHRLIALIADVPEELPEEHRLAAWAYLLEQDWVHKADDHSPIGRYVRILAETDPEFAGKVQQIIAGVLETKLTQLNGIGNSAAETLKDNDFDMFPVVEYYQFLSANHPRLVDVYNSAVALRMALRELS